MFEAIQQTNPLPASLGALQQAAGLLGKKRAASLSALWPGLLADLYHGMEEAVHMLVDIGVP